MRVAITGASGMIGSALAAFLRKGGHGVVPISRSAQPGGIVWDPQAGVLDPEPLSGLDAVVHLAGENIASERWTESRRAELRESRVVPTTLLASTLATVDRKPGVLVSASAVGIYGDHADEIVSESTPPSGDFLGELAVAWEASAEPARVAGIRTVHPRLATVLAANGGALEKMLPPFRLGIGGPLAGGEQWMHWVMIKDVVRAIMFLIDQTQLEGPFNVVAPGIVRNATFTEVLAAELHRPAVVPVPRLALKLLYGDLADEALLTSIRATPARLEQAGFTFAYPNLPEALHRLLAPPPA